MKKIQIIVTLILISSYSYASVEDDIEGCLNGDADSCDYAADAYEEGDGVVQNYQAAYKYYSRACHLHSGYGCRWVGIYLDPAFGEYGVEKSEEGAFNSYLKGCNLEDSTACNNLATSYKRGEGVEVDLDLARKYYVQACNEMEDGDACANLGYMYETGQGVKIDKIAAAKHYQKGCDEFEEGTSCYNLGLLLYYGKGVEEDEAQASLYFSKACEYGEEDGCDEI